MKKENNYFISIITVVYNVADLLEKTIKSIVGQTCTNFEYIIIDGASTDGTVNIIKKYANQINYWVSEPDEGLYHAMNKGLKMATGDFVWFINAGDEIFDENTLQNLVKLADRKHADLLYGETLIIEKNGNNIGMRRQTVPENLSWKSLKMGMVVCHQSFIPHRSIAPLYNLKYLYSSDIDWLIKCLKKGENIVNSKQILSRYLDGGKSKKTIIPSIKERFRIMVKNYGLISSVLNHIPIALRFVSFYFRHRRF